MLTELCYNILNEQNDISERCKHHEYPLRSQRDCPFDTNLIKNLRTIAQHSQKKCIVRR